MRLLVVASVLVFSSVLVFAGTPPPSTPELIAKGAKTFKTSCATCHGEAGDGKGPLGASLKPKPRNFVAEEFKFGAGPEQIFKTISEGSKGTSMAGFSFLSESDRWGLVYYVLSLKKK